MRKKNVATVTSKRQITLPADLFRQAGLKTGSKLGVDFENGRLILTPAEQALKNLDGVLKDVAPKHWRGRSAKDIIEQAKQDYFKHHRKRK